MKFRNWLLVIICLVIGNQIPKVEMNGLPTAYIFCDGFDYPVGAGSAKQFYDAQPFLKNNHLGSDWNAVTGGNSDLGAPILSVANGIVWEAKDYGGGWGKVIRVIHFYDGWFYESLYAHCREMNVRKGSLIKRGDTIGTIGNVNGKYLAHLHFEIRKELFLPLGKGYGKDISGHVDPTQFIKHNRPKKSNDGKRSIVSLF